MNLPDGFLLQDNKYRITSPIGQGGFGITYLAVWNTEVKGGLGTMKTEVLVCIKEYFFKDYCYREEDSPEVKIHSKTGAELFDKFKEKLIKEANILSEVHHSYIVNVLEVFEENNTAYIVMEYITGCSLRYMLDNKGALPENKALKYIHQIGHALDFVHEKNIVHLDIKPSNIIIDKDDNARLIDFGVSKRYGVEQQDISTTTLTLSKGFASVEQYDDESMQSFSPCPDIYSLGATMYNLLTGIIPVESILRVAKEILPPTAYNSNISPKTEKVILKSMELKAADRFRSVKEMCAALDVPPYEQSENPLVEIRNPFADGNNSAKINSASFASASKQGEDEEDNTIVALTPSKESDETIRKKKKKALKRRIFSAVAVFICVIAGSGMYIYLSGNDLLKRHFGFHNADTLQTPPPEVSSRNSMIFTKLEGSRQTNGERENTVTNKTDSEKNNNLDMHAKSGENNGKGGKTSGQEEGFISYSEQKAAENKEKEYKEFFTSAQDNFDRKKYTEADADIRNALKVKATEEANSLSRKIQEKISEMTASENTPKYETMTPFGNNIFVVKNLENNLYGAINRNGDLIIKCIYISTTYIPNGKAFIRKDNRYDTYDNNGEPIAKDLESIE